GVPPSRVRVEIADTTLPRAPLSAGSMTAASAGSAVKLAAESLREKLKSGAHDGAPYVEAEATAKPGPERGEQNGKHRNASAPNTQHQKPNTEYAMQGFGAQFCEIHIDQDTRMLRIARWTGAFALGKILNAKTATSQLKGGIVWGIGMGLLEETVPDPNYARYVNTNLAEYHVPVNKDVPPIEIILVPQEDRWVSPVGAKGAGEIGITGCAAA